MEFKKKHPTSHLLSSWWFFTNPSEKYAQVKIGIISPTFGMNIKKILNLPPPRIGLMGIHILAHYNPHIIGEVLFPVTPKQPGFFVINA